MRSASHQSILFFYKDTATSAIYTLSLHDALPIYARQRPREPCSRRATAGGRRDGDDVPWRYCLDRKSTRLNSSHRCISYAVFCLKKKKTITYFKIVTLT